jgi:hypothetical protein
MLSHHSEQFLFVTMQPGPLDYLTFIGKGAWGDWLTRSQTGIKKICDQVPNPWGPKTLCPMELWSLFWEGPGCGFERGLPWLFTLAHIPLCYTCELLPYAGCCHFSGFRIQWERGWMWGAQLWDGPERSQDSAEGKYPFTQKNLSLKVVWGSYKI